MISKDWSISGLAVELNTDRRGLARSLEGLQPHEEKQVGKTVQRFYKMAAVIAHLYKSGNTDLDLTQERARLAILQQQKIELEIAELRGELVRVEKVEEQWIGTLAAMRAKLLALPAKLAIAVATPDRIQAVQDKSQALIYEALSELAGGNDDDESIESDVEGSDGAVATAEADDLAVG